MRFKIAATAGLVMALLGMFSLFAAAGLDSEGYNTASNWVGFTGLGMAAVGLSTFIIWVVMDLED